MHTNEFTHGVFEGLPLFKPRFRMKKCGWLIFRFWLKVLILGFCIAIALKIMLRFAPYIFKRERKKTEKKRKRKPLLRVAEVKTKRKRNK
jgi:hypothetical protein